MNLMLTLEKIIVISLLCTLKSAIPAKLLVELLGLVSPFTLPSNLAIRISLRYCSLPCYFCRSYFTVGLIQLSCCYSPA